MKKDLLEIAIVAVLFGGYGAYSIWRINQHAQQCAAKWPNAETRYTEKAGCEVQRNGQWSK